MYSALFCIGEQLMADNTPESAPPVGEAFIATVIQCLPDIGHAVVLPIITTATDTAETIVATLPYTDGQFGSGVYPMYAPGTAVACVRTVVSGDTIVYITGSVNISLDHRMRWAETTKPYNMEHWYQGGHGAHAAWTLLTKLCPAGKHTWVRNRAGGVSADALPGDYDVRDKTGLNGLHIGRMVTQLRGSAMSFADAGTLNNALRLVGKAIERHTLVTEASEDLAYSVDNTAINIQEAFGIANGSIFKPVNASKDKVEPLELTDPFALPLYRIQRMKGKVLDGAEDVVLGWPADSDVHDSDHEPPVLSKVRSGLSGDLLSASTLGISSIKSPMITAAMQSIYGVESDKVASELRQPVGETAAPGIREEPEVTNAPTTDDPDRLVDDAALNKLIDTLLAGDYRQALLNIMAKHGFSRSNPEASIYARIESQDSQGNQSKAATSGMTQSAEYALPKSIELEDPVTHQKRTYYASMSFITQEPDGSICICDGYGSEIRMCRGNIYISPALDCIVRPGRDMSVMAGRHQAYNSQQTCTINSTTSTYIRAVKDLMMTGATGEKGKVLLECRNKETGVDYGMLIKGAEGLAITAKSDLYLGKSNYSSQQANGVVEDAGSGSVIIDAGSKGDVYVRGRNMLCNMADITLCANDGGSGTAFTLSANSAYMYTPSLVVSGNVQLKNQTRSILLPQGRTITLNAATEPSLVVYGMTHINGELAVSTLIRGEVAGDIISRGKGKACRTEYEHPDKLEGSSNPSGNLGSANAVYESIQQAGKGVYQSLFTYKNKFMFPESYDTDVNATIPGMVWQELSAQAGETQGGTWMESPVDGTACYPGYAAWADRKLSRRGYALTSLKSGYYVNAKLADDDIPKETI